MTTAAPLRIYYDGECPFCANYVQMAQLKRAAGGVDLIDARTVPATVERFAEQGFDIDKGMVAEIDGRIYFGWEAIWAMNALASNAPILRHFTSRPVLKFIYPVLRAIRNLTLRLMGKQPIRVKNRA